MFIMLCNCSIIRLQQCKITLDTNIILYVHWTDFTRAWKENITAVKLVVYWSAFFIILRRKIKAQYIENNGDSQKINFEINIIFLSIQLMQQMLFSIFPSTISFQNNVRAPISIYWILPFIVDFPFWKEIIMKTMQTVWWRIFISSFRDSFANLFISRENFIWFIATMGIFVNGKIIFH